MQRLTLSLLATLAAALPFASHAETMDYSSVELAYIDTELDGDGFDVDGDGFELRGSVAFHQNYFAYAGYQDLGFDFGIDATRFDVGVGGHWPLNPKIDVVGRVGVVKTEIEFDRFGADADDDGFLLGARLRSALTQQLEIEGGFDYTDLDDSGNDTSVVLEGRYFFMPQVSGGAKVEFADDATTIGIGARWTF
jgi:Outer membrane protein beta-barrel domain